MTIVARNQKLFKSALTLRKNGKSYSEIQLITGVAKSTLNYWFSNDEWSQQLTTKLKEIQNKRNSRYFKILNKSAKQLTILRHETYRKKARVEYTQLKNKQLFLIGLSLYWGEGEKVNRGRVSIINTDPDLLVIAARFYRNILRVSNNKLRIALFIYEDINETFAKTFWSQKLKLPKSQFIKTQVLPSRSKLTKRKSLYGVCNLYFSSTELNIKINEWIRILAKSHAGLA